MTRGRKSAAALSVVPLIDRDRSRPQPPAGLGKSEARLFNELALANDHLRPSDASLLAALCEAVVMRQAAAKAMHNSADAFQIWERSAKVMATLATRLRISPQSRTDSRQAGRSTGTRPLSYYETMRGQDDD